MSRFATYGLQPIHLVMVFVMLFGWATKATAQLDPTDSTRNRWVVLPVLYYTPETRLAFGATGSFYFRFKGDSTNSRPSTVQALAAYTINKQILLSAPFNLFMKQEKYWLNGQVAFYRYPYVFNGIGIDRPPGYVEDYTAQFPRVFLRALQQVRKGLYLGVRLRFQDTRLVSTADSAATDAGNVPSGLGTHAVPGGRGGISSGVGLALNWDTRDNLFFPRKGWFVQLSNLHQSGAFFSDFDFDTYTVDLRRYLASKNEHVLALQAYGEWNFGHTPFNRMAQIGGPNRMRGYQQGTYRDKKQLVFQAEYRSPYWRNLGFTVFSGFGGIADASQDFTLPDMLWTYGVGSRWRILPKERINFRFDLGFTEEGDREFYFTIGEAF